MKSPAILDFSTIGRTVNIYIQLFLTFAKVGVCTFGGGYAMLPILQREVVENRGWATDEDLTDYFAIGQCTPGIIAVNTATFIGSKLKGIPGGICATFGLIFPSLLIIVLIAASLSQFQDNATVTHAFNGIRACVCVLIINAVIKLAKSSLVDVPSVCIFLTVFGLSAFLGLSPALLVGICGLVGFIVHKNKHSESSSIQLNGSPTAEISPGTEGNVIASSNSESSSTSKDQESAS
jgi:chromate transporter